MLWVIVEKKKENRLAKFVKQNEKLPKLKNNFNLTISQNDLDDRNYIDGDWGNSIDNRYGRFLVSNPKVIIKELVRMPNHGCGAQ